MVEEFLNVLANANIANQGEDHWLWLEDSSSMDSVKSTYTALYDLRGGSNEINIFKSLWQIKIPHKVAFLLWRVFYDRIPTKSNLIRRGIIIDGGDTLCIFYHEMLEDTTHLLFSCRVIHLIWKRWFEIFDINSTLPRSAQEHFWQCGHGLQGNWWQTGWSAIVWAIWQQRNAMLFEGSNFEVEQIWQRIMFAMWSWMKEYCKDFNYSFVQGQVNPTVCLTSP